MSEETGSVGKANRIAYRETPVAVHHGDDGAGSADNVAVAAVDGDAVVKKHAGEDAVFDIEAGVGMHGMDAVGSGTDDGFLGATDRSIRRTLDAVTPQMIAPAARLEDRGKTAALAGHRVDRAVGGSIQVDGGFLAAGTGDQPIIDLEWEDCPSWEKKFPLTIVQIGAIHLIKIASINVDFASGLVNSIEPPLEIFRIAV